MGKLYLKGNFSVVSSETTLLDGHAVPDSQQYPLTKPLSP